MSGLFITLEGIEGSGKSTQIKRLAAYFEGKGREVLTSFEPGGTGFGQKLRDIVLDPGQTFGHEFTEILLFTADRLEHVSQVIEPALARGAVVICDRFVDSTVAYQMGGRALPEAFVRQMIGFVNLRPEKTFLLDIEVEEGLRRANSRADLDRFELEDLDFHRRVRAGYLAEAEREANRFFVVDVNGLDEDGVFGEILKGV